MRNWIIGAMGVAVIIGLIALLWDLQSADDGAPRMEVGKEVASANGTATAPVGLRPHARAASGEPDEPRQTTGNVPEPLRTEERTMEFERLLAEEVPGRIRQAAVHCFDGSGYSYKDLENDEKSLEFEYTASLQEGRFSLQELKLTKGINGRMDACVTDALSRLTWSDPVNPDFSMPMSDSISLLELKKWGEPMPHEVEEIPEEPPEEEE